jgi:hypothetical protein
MKTEDKYKDFEELPDNYDEQILTGEAGNLDYLSPE